jgi:HAD superfamily hydrolase (TIGR01549 family)
MASQRTKAVFLDGMGTLLRLLPPPLPADAFRAEVAYYVEHHLEGRDPESLAGLRRRCAAVAGITVDELMAAIRFETFDDVVPALTELRARGLSLVAVSNWDCSLSEVLERLGIAALLDGVVVSALVGVAKPGARIFEQALTLAGCGPAEVLHVGDSPENDIAGARAVGIRAVLLDRSGAAGPGAIGSLAELPALLSSLS